MTMELHAGHPLFVELRKKLLWHCTSASAFRKIFDSGIIRPIEGTSSRWGNRPYACQALRAVCLFDFSTQSEQQILGVADRWKQFIGSERPVTVIIGLDERKLSGRLVRYPENRDSTPEESSGPIPFVEVCHVGPIPISAIARYLLVCAADYARFKTLEAFDESALTQAETEYAQVTQAGIDEQAKLVAKFREVTQSPEFKAQMEQAKRRVEEMRKGK